MITKKGGIELNNSLVYDHFAADWLVHFNFDWRLLGTLYLCDLLSLILRDGSAVFEKSFTKEILPAIAKRRKTNWRAVERSMRYAIESAWLRGCPEVLAVYFPQEFEKTGRPSVKQFSQTVGLAAYHNFAQTVAQ